MASVASHFRDELDALQRRLLEMGGLAEERLRLALQGLTQRDVDATGRVLEGDDPLNRFHVEIDNRCFLLLAKHQPVAGDLRTIIASVKINNDLERIGDLAVNIAEAAVRYMDHPPVHQLMDIPHMGHLAQTMLRDALDAFVRRDVGLAERVLSSDDALDRLKADVSRDLLDCMLREPQSVQPALDLVLVTRHLERVGDHATNIAEDVIFVVSALDVRHQPLDANRRMAPNPAQP